MNHMEFTKRMRDSGLSREAQIIIAHIFERQRECLKQLDETAKILLALANSVQGLQLVQEGIDLRVQTFVEGRREKGVDLSSEPTALVSPRSCGWSGGGDSTENVVFSKLNTCTGVPFFCSRLLRGSYSV